MDKRVKVNERVLEEMSTLRSRGLSYRRIGKKVGLVVPRSK